MSNNNSNTDSFKWDEKLVKELLAEYWTSPVADLSKFIDRQIEQFKASHTDSTESKTIIFHDELGNAVYEGDKYWCVSKISYEITSLEIANKYSGCDVSVVYFKNESDAKDYVETNKPCLSLGEVGSILSGDMPIRILEQLKELVSSKLNNYE